MSNTLWISKLGFESLHPSQTMEVRSSNGAPVGYPAGAPRYPTLVDWALAPDWLTPGQAAQLLGPAYDTAAVLALIDEAAIVAEEVEGAGWLVEKRGLREFQEALWEVSGEH